MKFDDSPEIWALRPHPAPRGDVIYKNDLGEPMLRATRLGGLTLFTADRPGGSPAALTGAGGALRLAPLSPQALLEKLAQASARATRAARRLQGSRSLDGRSTFGGRHPAAADAVHYGAVWTWT